MLGPPCALVLDGMFSVRPRHRILWLTSRLEFATTVTGTRAGVNGSLNLPSSLAHVGLSAFRLASVTSGGENGHIPHLFGIWYKNRRTGYACFCTRFQGSELVSKSYIQKFKISKRRKKSETPEKLTWRGERDVERDPLFVLLAI